MKIRTITLDEYDVVCKKALEAYEESKGCRNKVKTYSDTMIRELMKAEERDLDENALYIIYYKTENLGTKRWGDWYKKICVDYLVHDPITHETKCYFVTISGERYYKDHILAVVI